MKFKLAQGGSDVGVADVARRPRVDRQLVARPASPAIPAASSSTRSPGRHLRRHEPGQPARQPLAGADPGDLLRQGPRLERRPRLQHHRHDRPRSSAPPPPARRTRSRRSSWAATSVTRRRVGRRPPTASSSRRSSRDKNAIGYVSLDFVAGTNAAAYNGVACNLRNAKSGEYGGVRNFWMVTRGAPTGDRSRSSSPGCRTRSNAQKIVGHALGAAEVDAANGSRRARGRTGAPSECSARWPCSCC